MNSSKLVFEEDDYGELNEKYFGILRRQKNMVADPSGWIDTYSNVGDVYAPFSGKLQGYHTDLSNQLSEQKRFILSLISQWDNFPYSPENITLCHSTTVASVIVEAFLISQGIRTIISETPNYFATYYQAMTMGINVVRMPTYRRDNFKLDMPEELIKGHSPCAVWLTQPRTALGINQNPTHVIRLLEKLSSRDFLVIDEATEQYFPSVLSSITPESHPRVIKMRSLFKGMGINGIRLACIMHHASIRSQITDEMENFMGALDVYSLNHAVEVAQDIARFKMMLSVANEQVLKLKKRADKVVMGTNCEVSPIENGYIGSGYITFNQSGLSRKDMRLKFIEYCSLNKVPVILGSAMGFPVHENMEFIRLNYFNRDYNILEGLRIISAFQG